jgi:hypothetical protein
MTSDTQPLFKGWIKILIYFCLFGLLAYLILS